MQTSIKGGLHGRDDERFYVGWVTGVELFEDNALYVRANNSMDNSARVISNYYIIHR